MPKKPTLPDDTPSFEWMVRDSITTIASRNTPWSEAAHLFGDRYGLLLALADAFRDAPGRSEPLQRMFDVARGLVSHGKKILQDAWHQRSERAVVRYMRSRLRGAVKDLRSGVVDLVVDPFAGMSAILDELDRQPDRSRAAIEFASRWARLRYMPALIQDIREDLPQDARSMADTMLRSAGHRILELEEVWCTRTFDELLGRPKIEELFRLVYPGVGKVWGETEE